MFSFVLVLVYPSREIVPVIVRIVRVAGNVIWIFLGGGGGQIYNGEVIFVLVVVTRGWDHLAVELDRCVSILDQQD